MIQREKIKIGAGVFGAGVFASSVVTPGILICVDKFLPHQMTGIKKLFATHFVAPHRELFDTLSKGVRRAHEKHDEEERAEMLSRGETPPPRILLTPEQTDYKIAEGWVTVLTALAVDLATTTGLQKLLDKMLGIKTQPFKTASIDLGVTMVGILSMPTIFAGLAENIHHSMSRWLRRATGMDKKRADDISVPVTYVGIPGAAGTVAGTLIALLSAHGQNSSPHK